MYYIEILQHTLSLLHTYEYNKKKTNWKINYKLILNKILFIIKKAENHKINPYELLNYKCCMIEKLHNLTETSPIKSPTLFPTKTF